MELELGRPKAREEPRGLARPRPQRHRRARRRIGRGRTPGWRIAARAAPPRARGRTNLHNEPRPRRRPGTRRRRDTGTPACGRRRRRRGGERPARVRPGVRTRRGPRGHEPGRYKRHSWRDRVRRRRRPRLTRAAPDARRHHHRDRGDQPDGLHADFTGAHVQRGGVGHRGFRVWRRSDFQRLVVRRRDERV